MERMRGKFLPENYFEQIQAFKENPEVEIQPTEKDCPYRNQECTFFKKVSEATGLTCQQLIDIVTCQRRKLADSAGPDRVTANLSDSEFKIYLDAVRNIEN